MHQTLHEKTADREALPGLLFVRTRAGIGKDPGGLSTAAGAPQPQFQPPAPNTTEKNGRYRSRSSRATPLQKTFRARDAPPLP